MNWLSARWTRLRASLREALRDPVDESRKMRRVFNAATRAFVEGHAAFMRGDMVEHHRLRERHAELRAEYERLAESYERRFLRRRST